MDEKSEDPVEVCEEVPKPEEVSNPKKRGRPAGARDKAPRKKTAVIVEFLPKIEKISESPKVEKPVAEFPEAQPSPEPPEPPSPRSLHREAARHILFARNAHLEERRTRLHHMVSHKLAEWPC